MQNEKNTRRKHKCLFVQIHFCVDKDLPRNFPSKQSEVYLAKLNLNHPAYEKKIKDIILVQYLPHLFCCVYILKTDIHFTENSSKSTRKNL